MSAIEHADFDGVERLSLVTGGESMFRIVFLFFFELFDMVHGMVNFCFDFSCVYIRSSGISEIGNM